MKVFLISKKKGVSAEGEHTESNGELIVKKGSILSLKLSESKTFRGLKTIQKCREGRLDGNTLTEDVRFKSPSTAANFVTGGSANGMRLWKTEPGIALGAFNKAGEV